MKNKVIFVFILIAVIFIFIPFIPAFSFTETRTDSPVSYYLLINEENNFQIVFTHTIHKTDVIENYQIMDSEILLQSMEYSDVAIGMPSYAEKGQTLIYKEGTYTLSNDEPVVLPHFTLFIGDVKDKLYFKYGLKKYDLKEKLEKGKSYKVEVKKLSLVEIMKGVNLNERKP